MLEEFYHDLYPKLILSSPESSPENIQMEKTNQFSPDLTPDLR